MCGIIFVFLILAWLILIHYYWFEGILPYNNLILNILGLILTLLAYVGLVFPSAFLQTPFETDENSFRPPRVPFSWILKKKQYRIQYSSLLGAKVLTTIPDTIHSVINDCAYSGKPAFSTCAGTSYVMYNKPALIILQITPKRWIRIGRSDIGDEGMEVLVSNLIVAGKLYKPTAEVKDMGDGYVSGSS
ncbi:MAG: hypothetical protein AB1665_01655 [Candidatus Thermoplasmatota archaeon]